MTKEAKKRGPASEALIALRKAMGKTQQTFAVEVLKTAIGTIARYESSDPPRGDVLLRLRDIAREQGLKGSADQFQGIWLEEVHKALGPGVRTLLRAEDGSGLLVASLKDDAEAFTGSRVFLSILQQLGSDDPKFRKNAVSALSSLKTAVRFDPNETPDKKGDSPNRGKGKR